MTKRGGMLLFLIYLIIGAYLIVFGLGIYTLPEALVRISDVLIFIGGVLVIFGGINHLRIRARKAKDAK